MDYETSTPKPSPPRSHEKIGTDVDYRPVETDGAARAAALIAELM